MKKLLFIALSFLSATLINAQEPADALRFAWTVPGATARVQAIGGAQGSLGGDITSTFMNPAGLLRSAARDYTRTAAWLRTDPQIPKSIWWYSDCFNVGFRVVCEFDGKTGNGTASK
ncbi:MAG: hypothetical protein ACXWCZ_07200 [Flavisolibacter sp.]